MKIQDKTQTMTEQKEKIMRTIQVNLYKFDELNEDAKEKAMRWARELDHSDWIPDDIEQFCESEWGNTTEVLKKYPKNVPSLPDIGLSAWAKKCDYSIDAYNQNHNHVTPESITIIDMEKLIEFIGIDKRSWLAKWMMNDYLEIEIYKSSNGKMKVFSEIVDWPGSYRSDNPDLSDKENQLDEFSKLIEEKINDMLSGYVRFLIRAIHSSYSKESMIEFIEANEYEFLESGKIA